MKRKNLGCLGWVLILILLAIVLRLLVCILSSFWSILGLILMIVALIWMRQEDKKNPGQSKAKQIALFVIGLLLVLIFSLICFFQNDSSTPSDHSSVQAPAQPVSQPKEDSKPSATQESKPETKTDTPTPAKPETPAPATQPDAKPVPETDSKPASQPTSTPATTPESQPAAQPAPQPQPQPESAPSSNVYYKNCTQVKAAGKAPLYAGEPGYADHLDRDGDGIACEK